MVACTCSVPLVTSARGKPSLNVSPASESVMFVPGVAVGAILSSTDASSVPVLPIVVVPPAAQVRFTSPLSKCDAGVPHNDHRPEFEAEPLAMAVG